MKTIISIIRWTAGVSLAMMLYLFVVTLYPMSLIVVQFLNRDSGTIWINALASNTVVLEGLRDSFLKSYSERESVDEPTKQQLKTALDSRSELGMAFRNVFNSSIIAQNLQVNSARFYDWFEGETYNWETILKVGGSKEQQLQLVQAYGLSRYNSLPQCSKSEFKKKQVNSTNFLTVNCKSDKVSSTTSGYYAKGYLAEPEIQKALTSGFTIDMKASTANRSSLGLLRRLGNASAWIIWAAIIIISALTLLLYTPRWASFFVTGLTLLLISGSLFVEAKSIELNLRDITSGQTLADAFNTTMGKSLTTQGWLVLSAGILLILVGAYLLVRKLIVVKEVSTVTPISPA